jgi:ribosomal protein S18 acetylase RimI-like enzyme
MSIDIIYKLAITDEDFEQGKALFKEYVELLGVDLSFQDFENELKIIDRQYNKPRGGLLLAFNKEQAIGCVGIRELDKETAELKRMYVRETYRGYHIGVELLKHSIKLARELGYKKIRLDTLKNMAKAQELYHSFGFYRIPSYRFNPLEGTTYMEKEL